MTPKIRVLIADDSAFARKVIREMLEGAQIEVVGAARAPLTTTEDRADVRRPLLF